MNKLINKLTIKLAEKFNLTPHITGDKVILKESVLGYGLEVSPNGEGVVIKAIVPENNPVSNLNESSFQVNLLTPQNISTTVKRVGNKVFNSNYIHLFQVATLKTTFR